MQGKKLSNKAFFSNGNRGVIYTADLNDGATCPVKVAVKELLHEKLLKPGRTSCPDALENEARWLRFMNKHGSMTDCVCNAREQSMRDSTEVQLLVSRG